MKRAILMLAVLGAVGCGGTDATEPYDPGISPTCEIDRRGDGPTLTLDMPLSCDTVYVSHDVVARLAVRLPSDAAPIRASWSLASEGCGSLTGDEFTSPHASARCLVWCEPEGHTPFVVAVLVE